METLSVRAARRLALARAGLLKTEWTGLPRRAAGRSTRARRAAAAIIDHFGYLQLDTVSIAGARSHTLVLLSRLEGFDPQLGEELLTPGADIFEYWGHEASWIPLDLYGAFHFRRQAFRQHPWWGDIIGKHPKVADQLVERIRRHGPIRSVDMEGRGSRGWWDLKLTKKVATALWSSGELAIRERRSFQRAYDLSERVIPKRYRQQAMSKIEGLRQLVLRALQGHGWATTTTVASTWRLDARQKALATALDNLADSGQIVPCYLENPGGRPTRGWIRPADLELAARLHRVRPRRDRGVLLSPFDPLLWDRARVQRLFGFHQILEIFKPAAKRIYGYFCLPVLAGERLVARFDLKAHRRKRTLEVLSCRFESTETATADDPRDAEAARSALHRYAAALDLRPTGWAP